MRLLSENDDGSLSLTKFVGKQIPSYAILSHRWESEDQEVTFQDLTNGTGVDKSGWRKILFCAAQTRKDGLKYFWFDSCAIDKTNSTELQEAITSMFRWYGNAARCYVYLSDVISANRSAGQWQSAFQESKWFTRGWTLQELLAPSSVQFFSSEQEHLGDKTSLKQLIHDITKIPIAALEGQSLSQFTIDERKTWTEGRETTIEEDHVYCLLGIFDVYLPLIYGEGRKHASRRLDKEIQSNLVQTEDSNTDPARRKEMVEAFLQLLYENACPYEDSKNRNRQRIPGTCNWFTEHEKFQNWIASTPAGDTCPNLLFVTADPGCGKSVLSRYLIDDVLPSGARKVCYFFFKEDFEDQKQSRQALCTLMHQLISLDRRALSDSVLEKYVAGGKRFLDSFHNLWNAFLDISGQGEVYCVIDALDECHEPDRKQLIEAICSAVYITEQCRRPHFVMTSRPYEHIRRQFDFNLRSDTPWIHLQGDQGPTADAIVQEIQLVINDRIDQTARIFDFEADERDLLRTQLQAIENRTYLWITLVFDGLLDSALGISRGDILNIASTLPQTVYHAYEKILSINQALDTPRRKALHIIIGAKRPMTLAEMSVAFAFQDFDDLSARTLTPDTAVPLSRMRSYLRDICGLFVTIVDDKVYLLHQTAREFLIGKTTTSMNKPLITSDSSSGLRKAWMHTISLEKSNDLLTKICVSYLGHGWDAGNALRTYAATYWAEHYRGSGERCQQSVAKMTKHLCGRLSEPTGLLLRQCLEEVQELPQYATPLSFASALGLGRAVELFLDEQRVTGKNDIQDSDEEKMTPLSWASCYGYEEIVVLLIEAGAAVEMKDELDRTPLIFAAGNGHSNLIQHLLKAGATIEAQDTSGRTALMSASKYGHSSFVHQLVTAGANIEARSGHDETALSIAAESGHASVVQQLLVLGANIEAKVEDDGATALILAAANGHAAVVQHLLVAGADIKAQDAAGRQPLTVAIKHRHPAIARQLMEAGADPNHADEDGRAPLYFATKRGLTELVTLLIEAGADVNKVYENLHTPLLWAVEKGYPALVQQLINAGADIEARNQDNRTPLALAMSTNNLSSTVRGDISAQLLAAGAKVDAGDYRCQTPLMSAARLGLGAIVQQMLIAGANIEAEDAWARTPLVYAVNGKSRITVTQLVQAGANVNVKDSSGITLLSYAFDTHDYEIVQTLTKAAVDINVRNPVTMTPLLQAATLGCHMGILKLLLEAGADYEAVDGEGHDLEWHLRAGGHGKDIIDELKLLGYL